MKQQPFSRDYENFLTTRPLYASFKKGDYDIPVMWKPTLPIEKIEYAKLAKFTNLASLPEGNYIVENFAFDSKLEREWRNPFSSLFQL